MTNLMKVFGYVNIEKVDRISVNSKDLKEAKNSLKRTPEYQLDTTYWKDVTKWVERNPKCFNEATLVKFRNIIFEKDIPSIRQTFTNIDGYDNYDKDGYVIGTAYHPIDTASWKNAYKWIKKNPRNFDNNTLVKFRDFILDPEIPPIRQKFILAGDREYDPTYDILLRSFTNTFSALILTGCLFVILQ